MFWSAIFLRLFYWSFKVQYQLLQSQIRCSWLSSSDVKPEPSSSSSSAGSYNQAWRTHRSHPRGPDHERRGGRQKWSVPASSLWVYLWSWISPIAHFHFVNVNTDDMHSEQLPFLCRPHVFCLILSSLWPVLFFSSATAKPKANFHMCRQWCFDSSPASNATMTININLVYCTHPRAL